MNPIKMSPYLPLIGDHFKAMPMGSHKHRRTTFCGKPCDLDFCLALTN